VHEYTNFKVFYFYQKKDQMAEVNCEVLATKSYGWKMLGDMSRLSSTVREQIGN